MVNILIEALNAGHGVCIIGSCTSKVAHYIASQTGRDAVCIKNKEDLEKYNNSKYLCCLQSKDLSLQKPFAYKGYLCKEDLVGVSRLTTHEEGF